jgi:hypothetical protein
MLVDKKHKTIELEKIAAFFGLNKLILHLLILMLKYPSTLIVTLKMENTDKKYDNSKFTIYQ